MSEYTDPYEFSYGRSLMPSQAGLRRQTSFDPLGSAVSSTYRWTGLCEREEPQGQMMMRDQKNPSLLLSCTKESALPLKPQNLKK